MNTLRGTLCLWLCLMYAGVECWPKVRLSSRQENDEESAKLRILYLIDTTVNATDESVKTFIGLVNTQAQQFLKDFFELKTILDSRTRYIKNDSHLETLMKDNNRYPYIYLDGTIYSLTSHFNEKNIHPDIICLVTGYEINDGDQLRKGYGYSSQKTLCDGVVTMILAYDAHHHYDISKMLAEMIKDSVNPVKVPYVHQKPDNLTQSMEDYLSQCNGSFEQEMPPDVPPKPTPEAPGTPGTPLPPGPPPPPSPPGPPQPPPEVTTTAEPELPKPNPPQPPVPPVTPKEPSSTEGSNSTTSLS
ncbi:protein piccolo-like, partial [Ixodes scapularis]|uniref:protein piccolo-like n=1 Tax=Ixodes scapularis TaxID=6945 RepID=UPI001A9FEB92